MSALKLHNFVATESSEKNFSGNLHISSLKMSFLIIAATGPVRNPSILHALTLSSVPRPHIYAGNLSSSNTPFDVCE